MNTYHCSIPHFSFTAYQYGKAELPEAVGVETLERKVGPAMREFQQEVEVEIVAPDGKTTIETRRSKVLQRVGRLSTGRSVIRRTMAVRAESESEARALFMRAAGVNEDGTSKKVVVVLAEASGSSDQAAPAKPTGKKAKPTADEAARAILGGQVPAEE